MTYALATVIGVAVGGWVGQAYVWHRLTSRRQHLTDWETDLRFQQAELARLFDVVADERCQLDRERNRGCGR